MDKLKPLTEKFLPMDTIIAGYDKRKRRGDWIGIIIHHTGVGGRKVISDKLWTRLYKNITAYLGAKDKNYVSAHFTIGRNGQTTEVVDPEKFEAFHAGKSAYWHPGKRRVCSNWNRYSIGIELIGDGNLHEYSQAQYIVLANLCATLMRKYPTIHPLAITGHENIAPGHKNDPGKNFDWHYFFRQLYVR